MVEKWDPVLGLSGLPGSSGILETPSNPRTPQNSLGPRESLYNHLGNTGIPRDVMHEKDFSGKGFLRNNNTFFIFKKQQFFNNKIFPSQHF